MARRSRESADELRSRAEAALARRSQPPDVRSVPDMQRLLHELEVHQVELQIQNEELRASRSDAEMALARFTELYDFAPMGYVTLDTSGVIRAANFACSRLLATPRGKLVGRPLSAFVDAIDADVLREFLAKLVRNTEHLSAATCDASLVGTDQYKIRVRLTATLMAGKEPAILCAIDDVTERTRMEEALREANRHKDEFLAVLSHELRNPLAPIVNSLFLLELSEPGSDQARKAQAVIERQVNHLARLVDDLLDVTRIAQGKIRLQRQRVALEPILRKTLDDYRSAFDARHIHLAERYPSTLVWVDADETRMAQVLGNLLSNASKYTPEGGQVDVSLQRERDRAVLRIRDTGVGIAPDVLKDLFEPFVQGEQSLDRSQGGLGLGLAMVKGLVELHGGTVSAASLGTGQGSEFSVFLPVAPPPVPEVTTPAVRSHEHRRVLIIEDSVDTAESLRFGLEFYGHDVRIAFDGNAGIKLAHAFRPDVVLCDIGLPSISGYEVAKRLRTAPDLKDTLLVALTGYALPEDQQRSAEAGFDKHIAKPPNLRTLNELISA